MGEKTKKKQPSLVTKTYLIFYNTASFLAWGYVLLRGVQCLSHDQSLWHKMTTRDGIFASKTAYAEMGYEVTVIQTTAVLEVLHVLLGLVRTSLMTTASQVASRLFVVYACLGLFPQTQTSPFFLPMVMAWSIAEMTRYANYVTNLVGTKLYVLEYLRYTLFYILYPLGAGSEATFIFNSAPYAGERFGAVAKYAYLGISCVLWPTALFGLMSYMHAQRKKYLYPKTKPLASKKKQ